MMTALHSETIVEVTKALVAVQAKLLPVVKAKTANAIKYSYDYADLADVWAGCRTLLAENNLAVSQLGAIQDGNMLLTTLLLHVSGEWLSSTLRVNAPSGDPQAVGSALTYARRYALAAIVGVVVEGEDDDAESAAKAGRSQPRQARSTTAGAKAEGVQPDSQYMCPIHHVLWFKRGRMKDYAHTIGDTSAWCNMTAVKKDMARDSADLFPGSTGSSRADADGVVQAEVIGNLKEFMTWAQETYGYESRDTLCRDLGCEKPADILKMHGTFDAAAQYLVAFKANDEPESDDVPF